MKRGEWLKKTLLRLLALGIACLVLVWFILYIPIDRSKRLITSQLQASGQAQDQLQSAKDLLLSVPRIEGAPLHQAGFFRDYADTVSQAAKKLNKLSITYVVPKKIWGINISSKGRVTADANSQITSIKAETLNGARTDLRKSRQLMDYQALVSSALTNILEYDASLDTTNFSLGSDDSSQRLQLAQTGLSKTLEGLQRAKPTYDDPSLIAVISQIKIMQAARDKLAQDGNTLSWIQAVNAAQETIVSNRNTFWESHISSLSRGLESDIDGFARLEQQWNLLDKKYNS